MREENNQSRSQKSCLSARSYTSKAKHLKEKGKTIGHLKVNLHHNFERNVFSTYEATALVKQEAHFLKYDFLRKTIISEFYQIREYAESFTKICIIEVYHLKYYFESYLIYK